MTLRIRYETEGFPVGTIANGIHELDFEWDDLLWAAITVGRPNRQFVFRHGNASAYEALFRLSMVRMALEQKRRVPSRLFRTDAFKTLDPSEKGAITYFLGLTCCKLFAAKLLNTPWLLHLDVFRPQLNPKLIGRSRPDLVGLDATGNVWHAFESKGRGNWPDAASKVRAKAQAQRLVQVNSMSCGLHVGAITYFYWDVLYFYWRDPTPDQESRIELTLEDDSWRSYYEPIRDFYAEFPDQRIALDGDRAYLSVADTSLPGADVRIGLHPAVSKYLLSGRWNDAHYAAIEASEDLLREDFQPDGTKIAAGESWPRGLDEVQ